MPAFLVDVLRVLIGLTGAVILLAAATTSISGIGRVVYSLGRHQMLPHVFGTFGRRSTLPPAAILGAAAVSSTLVILAASLGNEVRFLASLYSFGVLITFAIAQAAVVRLRYTEPDLERPFVVPFNVRIRGRPVPVAALVGIPLVAGAVGRRRSRRTRRRGSAARSGSRSAPSSTSSRASRRGSGLLERVEAARARPRARGRGRVRDGSSCRSSSGRSARRCSRPRSSSRRSAAGRSYALHVIRVPLDLPLDAELLEQEERASASLIDAKLLAAEHGVRDRERHRPRPRDRRGDRRRRRRRSAPT